MRKLIVSLLIFQFLSASAQKLPNKQEASIWAPDNIKIDGLTREWDYTYKAYNHATDISYTIANNDEYLYLCIEATEQAVINKIVNGGITFSLRKYGDKKNKKDVVSITYPVFQGDPLFFLVAGRNSENISPDIIKSYNKRLEQKCKSIGIKGIPGLDDLISVYNTDGVKAEGRFNNQKAYVCEFAIAMKYLKIPGNDPSKFSYHLVINGAASMGKKPMFEDDGRPHGPMMEKIMAKQAIANTLTDFWGEYTLAKKP